MKDKKTKRHSLREKMMALNLSVTLLSLIFCGVVFICSVWLIVGKYIEHDLDFFLTETNNNLNTKTEYLENIIYEIRGSEELMAYLDKAGKQELDEKDQERLQNVYTRTVNISSQKNLGNGNEPIVEKVYLFDSQDDFLFTGYYAMVESEVQKSREEAIGVYNNFRKQQEEPGGSPDYCYYPGQEGREYLAFTLYDRNMKDQGSVIFEIRLDVLEGIMDQVDNYKGAFWMLYDQRGNIIVGENYKMAGGKLGEINQSFQTVPYEATIDNTGFRLYTEDMSMYLRATIGIPEGQTTYLLYDSVKIYIFILAVICVGVFAAFVTIVYHMTKPLKEFTEKLQSVKEGDFETKLPDYSTEEFHEISLVFNEMTEYVNYLIKQVYEKQLSIKEMELKFLQTQVNPHFMFNVLNTIALQARLDQNEETYKMITSFSQLIQAKIYRKDTEKVQIRQELEYVEYYLYLQSYRYGDRLNYNIQVEDEEVLGMFIPKLCLQLIVENAVVHGIEPKLEPGFVEIVMYEKERSIYIEISDDGVGFDQEGEVSLPINKEVKEKGHNHVGLNNAHHIIQLTYGEKYGIHIFSKKGEGSRVTVHIPFDEGNCTE